MNTSPVSPPSISAPATNGVGSTSSAATVLPPLDELPDMDAEQSLTVRAIEQYSGGPPPPNGLYYPSYMVVDFRSLSNTELENRERSGLNSLPESKKAFKLEKSSGWKMVVRAVLMGSPRQKLTLHEIKLILNTRFPGLIERMDSDNVIRHTLSFQPEFCLKDRHWTIESFNSITTYKKTKAKGKRLGRPAKEIYRNSTHPFTIITFPAEPEESSTVQEGCNLPSIQQLIESIDPHPNLITSSVSHEIFGYRGLMEVVNQQQPDLKTMAQRWGL